MTQDINVNAFAETLNDKLDRDLKNSAFNMDLVIAYKAPTAQDPTWYRQYKSGWVEQGGKSTSDGQTVTFPIQMSNTEYFISGMPFETDTGAISSVAFASKTTTSVLLYGKRVNAAGFASGAHPVYWEVKGFAANPEEGGDDESTYGNVYKTYFYNGIYPDYSNGSTLLNGVYPTSSTASSVTIQNDGIIRLYGQRTTNGNTLTLYINDHIAGVYAAWAAAYANEYFPVHKNDVIKLQTDATSSTWQCYLYWYPYLESAQSTVPSITTLVNAMYPVGSIYIGTTVNCPLASIVGTWTKIDGDLVLQSSSQAHQANTTIAAGLPNITGQTAGLANDMSAASQELYNGAFYKGTNTRQAGWGGATADEFHPLVLDASRSSPIYGNSDTVQPPAYVVNIWKRTA